jgi:ketosteroid isomerase-like protein
MRRPLAAAALAAIGAGPLYRLATRSLVRYVVRRLSDGDPQPLLRLYSEDARLVFPGQHSWGGEYRGKLEIEGFLRRFTSVGLKAEVDEILVNGPPWSTDLCIRFTDNAQAPDGTVVYANRVVVFAKLVWGKIVFEETYEDTQKVVDLEQYLEAHEPELAVRS